MQDVVFIYWLLAGVLIYAYFGYAVIAWLFQRPKMKRRESSFFDLPSLTCIIPCFNEEKTIEKKLRNTISLHYPVAKIKIVVVDDGSTDKTAELVRSFKNVTLITHVERKGKSAALNSAMQMVDTEFVFFSDANALLNKEALQLMMAHFAIEKVGGVAGEKKIGPSANIVTAEGWYWQYESFLKKLDAAFYSVVSATGEAFALRTALFKPIQEGVILDDFFLSMHICQQGKVIAYEPGAYATELPSQLLAEEFQRKVRIAAGAFQTFGYISLKKMIAFPRLLFQLFSRRWLRWLVCPLAIPLILVLNVFIVSTKNDFIYTFLLALQFFLYALAILGIIYRRRRFPLFALPFYFLFMNFCMLAGGWLFFKKQQTVFWRKAERS